MKALHIILMLGISFGSTAFAARYKLDAAHMKVGFSVKHLVISTVHGRFDKFEGHFDFDKNTGKLSGVEAKIDIDSINTNEPKRDAHLKNPDFFGVYDKNKKMNPKKRYMTFKSTKVVNKGKKPANVSGKLTMNGITRPVTLDVDYKGATTDPWGNKKVVFSAITEIKRKDFGLKWNKALEAGGVVVGENIKIHIEGEADQQ